MNSLKAVITIGVTGLSALTLAQDKPNVLFFLVDDLGWKDLSANGSVLYETPNIDEVLNQSVYFSNAYSAYPRCVPSRYAMITGRHPARDGQTDGNKVRKEELTMAEAFRSNGYGTFFAGKWHLGKTEDEWPHNNGFDVNKGGCDAGAPGSYFFPYGSEKFTNPYMYGLENGKEGEYITDRLTDETIEYIRANREKPFLAYVAHYAVHTPFQAKKEKIDYYEKKIKDLKYEGQPYVINQDGKWKQWQDNAVYAAMVESMDESFGRIIKTLKELGLYDNTIIVFTSDHGGLSNTGVNNNRELATTNLPLRAGKGHIYEGGIKVPVFVRWPGVADQKSTTDQVITGMDYFPSLLEMCGLEQHPEAHLDGISFASVLRGEEMKSNRVFYWHQTAARPESTGDHNSSVIRKGAFKLHYFHEDGRTELYNLNQDPYEKNNIALKKPEKTEELMLLLEEWKKEARVDQRNEKKKAKAEDSKIKNQNSEMNNQNGVQLLNPGFEEGLDSFWKFSVKKKATATINPSKNCTEGKTAAEIIVESATEIKDVTLESNEIIIQSDGTLSVLFDAMANPPDQDIKIQVIRTDKDGNKKYGSETVKLTNRYKSYVIRSEAKNEFQAVSIQLRIQCGTPGARYYLDNFYLSLEK